VHLGLDISTSITGYAILDHNGKIIKIDAIDLKNKNKFPDMFSKALHVQEHLRNINRNFPITKIAIEPSLMMFSMGKSSAATIATLLKFNGIISWICEQEYEMAPEFIPAISARKICGIKVEKGKKAKQCVMEHLLKTEPDFAKLVQYTKQNNIIPKYWDMADAYVIARASFLKTIS